MQTIQTAVLHNSTHDVSVCRKTGTECYTRFLLLNLLYGGKKSHYKCTTTEQLGQEPRIYLHGYTYVNQLIVEGMQSCFIKQFNSFNVHFLHLLVMMMINDSQRFEIKKK